MLVKTNAVEAQLFHAHPGVKVLAVVLHRQVRAKMPFGQRIGQFAVRLEMV